MRKILLVEDSPSDVELTIRALRKSKLDAEVFVAEDGAEALDYLFCMGKYANREGCGNPDLILLDLNIPKIDGNQVLSRIRAHQPTKLIPVVVLTSSNEEYDLKKAYNSGANSYIRKPVNFSEFSDVVAKLGHYWLEVNEPPPMP
mgnify:CR=1 FL=1